MYADTHTMDDILAALADSRRRRIVRTLRNSDDDVLTVDELASELTSNLGAGETTTDQGSVDVDLYHVHLPKLDEAGLVVFDTRNREVEYRSVDLADELLALVDEGV